jgi:hypothetical protein
LIECLILAGICWLIVSRFANYDNHDDIKAQLDASPEYQELKRKLRPSMWW